MAYQVRRLLPRHYKILDLLVQGFKHKEVADLCGVTPQNVSDLSRSPIFKAELDRRLREVRENRMTAAEGLLQESAERAAAVQVDLLDSEDHSVRLRASNSILDRVIGKPGDNSSGVSATTITVEAKQANLLLIALKESQNVQGLESAALLPSPDGPEGREGNVYQASVECSGVGHRSPEAQASEAEVIDYEPNGSQETPQPKGT